MSSTDSSAAVVSSWQRFGAGHPARTVTVAGMDWQIIAAGSADPTVLLLPGGTGQAEAEWQAIGVLEPRVRVIAVSYPLTTSLDRLVDGLVGVLDAEGLSTVYVWGNSFGGMVAQMLARRAPRRVAGLVLGRTAAPDPARARRAMAQQRLLYGLPEAAVRVLSRLAFARLLRTLPPAERDVWRDYLDREFLPQAKPRMLSLSALAADFYHRRDIRAGDLDGWPGRILILEAAGDRLYGPMAARVHALHPQAQVHRLRTGDHVSDTDRLRAEARTVLDFITQHTDDAVVDLRIPAPTASLAATRFGHRGEVVLLLHGGPGCPDYLAPVARQLSTGMRAVTFDQRGVGGSTSNGSYRVEDYLTDIEAVRTRLAADKVHLFGHSWGALLAQLYLRAHPQRVHSLFLANSSIGVGADWLHNQRAVLAHNRRRSGPAGFAAMGLWSGLALLPPAADMAGRRVLARVWRNYFPHPAAAPPADPQWLAGARTTPARATVAQLRALPAATLDTLPATVPTVVLYGDQDIYGDTIGRVRKRFPTARQVTLPDCGHLPWLQAPDAFDQILRDFYRLARP